MNFDHFTPTCIVFGRGRISHLGTLSNQFGKRALLVCGMTSMRQFGVVQRITDILYQSGIDIFVYDRISPNPRSNEIDACLTLAREQRIDFVIGLGGGSAIDSNT